MTLPFTTSDSEVRPTGARVSVLAAILLLIVVGGCHSVTVGASKGWQDAASDRSLEVPGDSGTEQADSAADGGTESYPDTSFDGGIAATDTHFSDGGVDPTPASGGVCPVTAIAVRRSSCAVRADGTLWCWGDGGALPRPANVAALGSDVAKVAVGEQTTCALKKNGTLWCWAAFGVNGPSPVLIPGLTDVASMTVGERHACALVRKGQDSSIWCWGKNESGQLGDNTTIDRSTPVRVVGLGSDISDLAGGSNHSCVLLGDTTVACWGDNSSGQIGDGTQSTQRYKATVVPSFTGVRKLIAGANQTCGILSDDSLWCWGRQNGTFPTKMETFGGDIADAWCGGEGGQTVSGPTAFTCALKRDGSLWCGGRNSEGELGIMGALNGSQPVKQVQNAPPFIGASAGTSSTCAFTAAGRVYCWGYNASGALGVGYPWRQFPAVVAGGFTDWTEVHVGWDQACGRRANGSTWCWGGTRESDMTVTPPGSTVPFEDTAVSRDVRQLAVHKQICWLTAAGTVSCRLTGITAPVTSIGDAGNTVTNISVGPTAACARRSDGTSWCWDETGLGRQMGEWGTDVVETVDGVCAKKVDGTFTCVPGTGVAGVSGDCFWRTDGTVSCQPTLTNVAEVSAGCARKVDGAVWCWYPFSQGATAPTPDDPAFAVSGLETDVVRISAARGSACALKKNGTLWCWGNNRMGQLGDGQGGAVFQRPQLVDCP